MTYPNDKQKKQLERARQIAEKHVKEKAWCKVHPTGFIGRDQFNNWYDKCVTGHRFNERCEIVVENDL